MHRVTHCIRRIPPVEVPIVADVDGTERIMNEQELLNLGVVHIRGDVYSCCVQESTDDGRTWTSAVALPGVELSRGRPKDRFRHLPPQVRSEIMNAQVERTTGSGSKRKTETITVPESEILPGDVIKKQGLVPHMWAGERER